MKPQDENPKPLSLALALKGGVKNSAPAPIPEKLPKYIYWPGYGVMHVGKSELVSSSVPENQEPGWNKKTSPVTDFDVLSRTDFPERRYNLTPLNHVLTGLGYKFQARAQKFQLPFTQDDLDRAIKIAKTPQESATKDVDFLKRLLELVKSTSLDDVGRVIAYTQGHKELGWFQNQAFKILASQATYFSEDITQKKVCFNADIGEGRVIKALGFRKDRIVTDLTSAQDTEFKQKADQKRDQKFKLNVEVAEIQEQSYSADFNAAVGVIPALYQNNNLAFDDAYIALNHIFTAKADPKDTIEALELEEIKTVEQFVQRLKKSARAVKKALDKIQSRDEGQENLLRRVNEWRAPKPTDLKL